MKIRIRKFNERTDDRMIEYSSDHTIIHTTGGEMSLLCDKSEFLDIFIPDGIWVALDGDKIIGVVLFGRDDKENTPCTVIYGIRVDEPYHRRGIGGILLQKADVYARANRFDRIILHTTSDNIASIKLFRKAGYIITEHSGDKLQLIKKIRFR